MTLPGGLTVQLLLVAAIAFALGYFAYGMLLSKFF